MNAVCGFGEHQVLSGSSDATLRLWNLKDGSCEKILKGHKGAVLSVSPLEKTLVLTGSTDRTARIWDLSNGAQLGALRGHSHWVNSVVVFGKTAVTVSNDKARARACLGCSPPALALALRRLLSRSVRSARPPSPQTVRMWNPSGGGCLRTIGTPSAEGEAEGRREQTRAVNHRDIIMRALPDPSADGVRRVPTRPNAESVPVNVAPTIQKIVPFEERARAERERREAEREAEGSAHDAAPAPAAAPTPSGHVKAQRMSFQQAVSERKQKLAPERPPRASKAPNGAAAHAGGAQPAQKRPRRGLRGILLDTLVSKGALVALTAAGASGGVAFFMGRSAAASAAGQLAGAPSAAAKVGGASPQQAAAKSAKLKA